MSRMKEGSLSKNDIMIVDDNPANLKLLEDILLQQRHEVRSFPLGRLALASAIKKPPDLILLDINMPEMNGYEVCESLKASQALRAIPVIFLSALTETQDKVKAFHSGAVDYISKPFQFEEVHARVETHLELYALQQSLKLDNEHLELTVAERTFQLAEANQRLTLLDRSKSEFLKLISHEFRTPLHGLLGVGELLLDGMPPTDDKNRLQGIFDRSRQRILSILDDALLLTQIDVNKEPFSTAPVSLCAALTSAIEKTAEFAKFREVTLTPPPPDRDVVLADENLLVRALQALLETAIKFSEKGGTVRLSYSVAPTPRRFLIVTEGRKVPDPALPKFFDLFSIGDAITPGGDLGVGLPLAYRILSLFGLSLSVANREPSGIELATTLKT